MMNNDQAMFVLRSYRAGGEDAADPAFHDALDQAARDPALNEWVRRESDVDRVVGQKLDEFPVPHSLAGDILAARRPPGQRAAPRRSLRAALCAAAVIGISLGILLLKTPPLQYASFAEMAAASLNRPFWLDLKSTDVDEIKQWLSARGVPGDVPVAMSLTQLAAAGIGCRSFTWRGERVALICFTLRDGAPAHFFVMDRASLAGVDDTGNVFFGRNRGWNTATWADDSRVYVLASTGGRDVLEKMIPARG